MCYRAINLVPRLVDAHWHKYCLFIIQNDPSSAMTELDTILGLNRRHTKAYRAKYNTLWTSAMLQKWPLPYRALLLKDSGDLKEALFCLSQAVVLDRKNKTVYRQRAMVYEQVILYNIIQWTCCYHSNNTTERRHRISHRRLPDNGGHWP